MDKRPGGNKRVFLGLQNSSFCRLLKHRRRTEPKKTLKEQTGSEIRLEFKSMFAFVIYSFVPPLLDKNVEESGRYGATERNKRLAALRKRNS